MMITHRSTRSVVLVLLGWLVCSGAAFAHIANEKTQFPDIGAAAHADDIVLLVGLGVIPQTPVFRPGATLTRSELAAWAALAHRAAEGGEAPDMSALAKAGAQWVDSLDGDATRADVNKALFDGRLTLSDAERTLSRDAAAALIASHLDAGLLAQLGASEGPTGKVSEVQTKAGGDGHASYTFDIGDQAYRVYAHARVVGPTDLTRWADATISRSYLRHEDGADVLAFMQQGEAAPAAAQPTATGAQEAAGADSNAGTWLIGLIALLVLLGIALFWRRRPRQR